MGKSLPVNGEMAKNPSSIFILIHGAWYTANCWKWVKKELEDLGSTVITVNLPNYSLEKENPKEITLDSYVQAVMDIINTLESKPVLVGHSMGGIVLSQLASDYPEKIEALIYLSAFLLRNGESIKSFIDNRPNTKTGAIKALMKVRGRNGETYAAWRIDHSTIKERFYSDAILIPKDSFYPVTPYTPITTPLRLSKAFEKVKKHYITCLNDQAITFKEQDQMLLRARLNHKNIAFFASTSISTSHSPFFLKSSSEELAKVLCKIADCDGRKSTFPPLIESENEKAKEKIKIGLIKGEGTGSALANIFVDFLEYLDILSSKSTHTIIEDKKFYHSFETISLATINSRSTSEEEANRLFLTYKSWFNNDNVRTVFRTSVNAEAAFSFARQSRNLKVIGFKNSIGARILIVNVQSEGYYANTKYDISDKQEKIKFHGEYSKNHQKEAIKYAQLLANKDLGSNYEKWAIYKFDLFGKHLKSWFNEIDPDLQLFLPDSGISNFFKKYIFSDSAKKDLLLICSNEVGDLIFQLTAGALNLDPTFELYTRNVPLSAPFHGILNEYQTVHGSADDLASTDRIDEIRPDATLRIAADIAEKQLGYSDLKRLTDIGLVNAQMKNLNSCEAIVSMVKNTIRETYPFHLKKDEKIVIEKNENKAPEGTLTLA